MSTRHPPPRSPSKISRATRAVGRKIEGQFSRHGWAFRRLAISHATNVTGGINAWSQEVDASIPVY